MSKRRCRWAAALGAVCLAGAVAAPAHADWRAFRGPNAGHHRSVCGDAAVGQARCLASVNTSSTGKPLAAAGPAGYNPVQLQAAYSLPSSTAGKGQTVAIVDAYNDPSAESDLAAYRSQFGLAPCTTGNGCFRKVNQSGNASPLPAGDVGWSEEISLDLDMVSAICPDCHILLVEATSPTLANLATAVNTAVRLGATEVSNSYGGSESGASYYASAYNHPGVAITASAGDDGYGVSFPASAKTVTAVGGTSLTLNSSGRVSETVWSGTGSGCSRTFTQPAWQTSRLPVAGVCSRRVVGDVAAVADPGTGVSVYDTYGESGWLVFGGTSVSAPIIASVYALAGNARTIGSTGEPLPYLYGTSSNLFDVTSGRNGSCGSSYLCTARAGYDGPTGLGTPIGVSAF
jgi:subtilase family serine protease